MAHGPTFIAGLLSHLGHVKESTRDTPDRLYKVLLEMTTRGEPPEMVTFEEDRHDEMVLVSGIRFYALCPHHLLPYFGLASVAYIADGPVVGLSKIPRLVAWSARGLQTQEAMTSEICTVLHRSVDNKGVACIIHARHLCLEARGVRAPGAVTTTSVMKGAFLDDGKARSEILHLIRQPKPVM